MVRHLNPRILGVTVGGFICFTNARVIMGAAGIEGNPFVLVYAGIVALWVAALVYTVLKVRSESGARAKR